jgi:hypothetical protein
LCPNCRPLSLPFLNSFFFPFIPSRSVRPPFVSLSYSIQSLLEAICFFLPFLYRTSRGG